MSDYNANKSRRAFEEFVQQTPPPEWVRKMVQDYYKTGTYRPQDLRRLLGDPRKSVEVGAHPNFSAYFCQD